MYSEIEPLSISSCVVIVLENQVILVLTDLDSSSKVTRFKTALKYQGVVVIVFFLVICLQLAIVSIYLWHLRIKVRTLARWSIGIILPVIHGVLLRWQLNEIILINIRSIVAFPLLRGKINAVEHNFLSLRCVVQ